MQYFQGKKNADNSQHSRQFPRYEKDKTKKSVKNLFNIIQMETEKLTSSQLRQLLLILNKQSSLNPYLPSLPTNSLPVQN